MSFETGSWEVFALFGFKRTETISNSLIFVYHLWNNDFEEEKIESKEPIEEKETIEKDVKDEINQLFVPIIDLLLKEIYPYIFLSMIFVVISFLLILGIFILLLRNNKSIKIPFFGNF